MSNSLAGVGPACVALCLLAAIVCFVNSPWAHAPAARTEMMHLATAGVGEKIGSANVPAVTGGSAPRRNTSAVSRDKRPHSPPRRAATPSTQSRQARPASVGARQIRVGGWTPEIGVAIARRALAWVGTPYSWAGGDASGPTRGTAVDDASRHDNEIVGFDCSGLVINAVAPWRALAHYAATQYLQAGSVHPALDQLLPGDLIFWSPDGTVDGITHVAVYIGGGMVVQAPHSGAWVTVTPANDVEAGAIGTTRPLT